MATPAILQENSAPPVTLQAALPRPAKPQRLWIQLILLIVTSFTTTAVGMRYMVNFQQGKFPLASDADIFPYQWAFANLRHLGLGLPFSLTLLGILLTHEFGHYFACRYYGIRATLPYLLPAPSLSGTAGAVIRLRSKVKSRSALMAIGAFGPVSGFVVATVMACVGITLSQTVSIEPVKLVSFTPPLLLRILFKLMAGVHPLGQHVLWHPVLVASWIGILITSLNLVPAGQLDGGHILYAISPKVHRYITYVVMATLIYLGIVHWIGWLLWMALLLLPGMRHPKVQDPQPPTKPLMLMGPLCLAMLALCAIAEPFSNASLLHIIHRFSH
jgi:Zn-dependent protease